MKRASYRDAVAWVAANDSDGDDGRLDVERVAEIVSTVLVADIFDVDRAKVAADVVRRRKKNDREDAAGGKS